MSGLVAYIGILCFAALSYIFISVGRSVSLEPGRTKLEVWVSLFLVLMGVLNGLVSIGLALAVVLP